MTDYTRGGRGKIAPYETVMYRIPEPMKPFTKSFANQYRRVVGTKYERKFMDLMQKMSVAGVVSAQELLSMIEDSKDYDEDKESELSDSSILDSQLARIEDLEWQVKKLKNTIETLESERSCAIAKLKQALQLKPNAGGKIKQAIREAYPVLTANPDS